MRLLLLTTLLLALLAGCGTRGGLTLPPAKSQTLVLADVSSKPDIAMSR